MFTNLTGRQTGSESRRNHRQIPLRPDPKVLVSLPSPTNLYSATTLRGLRFGLSGNRKGRLVCLDPQGATTFRRRPWARRPYQSMITQTPDPTPMDPGSTGESTRRIASHPSSVSSSFTPDNRSAPTSRPVSHRWVVSKHLLTLHPNTTRTSARWPDPHPFLGNLSCCFRFVTISLGAVLLLTLSGTILPLFCLTFDPLSQTFGEQVVSWWQILYLSWEFKVVHFLGVCQVNLLPIFCKLCSPIPLPFIRVLFCRQ